jgi:hypothetical protein
MRGVPKLLSGLVVSLALAVPAFPLETFADEAKSQQHCAKRHSRMAQSPDDDLALQGTALQRWYANTKHGAFACEKEAGAAGARATRNGQ